MKQIYILNIVIGVAASVLNFSQGNISGGCGYLCSALGWSCALMHSD